MRGRARSWSDRYMRERERQDAIDFARARQTPTNPAHPFRAGAGRRGNGAPLREHTWEESPWSDESTRELAARHAERETVNAWADYVLRQALGDRAIPTVCERCGISFLAVIDPSPLCHVCFGERLAEPCTCLDCLSDHCEPDGSPCRCAACAERRS